MPLRLGRRRPSARRERRALRHLEQDLCRADLVDEARGQRLRGSKRPARQDQVEGRREPDETRQPLRAARPRQQAQHHLRQPDRRLRGIGRHTVAARERELCAAAETGTVDRRHDRHPRGRDPVEDSLAGTRERLGLLGRAQAPELLDVRTRDEAVRLPAADDDRLHGSVVLRLAQQLGERGDHPLRQDVQLLPRHVDREHEDAVAPLLPTQRVAVAHRITPSLNARAPWRTPCHPARRRRPARTSRCAAASRSPGWS